MLVFLRQTYRETRQGDRQTGTDRSIPDENRDSETCRRTQTEVYLMKTETGRRAQTEVYAMKAETDRRTQTEVYLIKTDTGRQADGHRQKYTLMKTDR